MRIPLQKRHYLTDAYVNKFDLDKKTFYNVDNDENSFVSVRGVTVRVSGRYCSHAWHNAVHQAIFQYSERLSVKVDPAVPQNRETYRSPTHVGSFEVCVLAHIALRMLSAITLASQWHFLANKHAVLAGCSAFWPVNCIFLHKNARTRCTPEWDFCISSYGGSTIPQHYMNNRCQSIEVSIARTALNERHRTNGIARMALNERHRTNGIERTPSHERHWTNTTTITWKSLLNEEHWTNNNARRLLQEETKVNDQTKRDQTKRDQTKRDQTKRDQTKRDQKCFFHSQIHTESLFFITQVFCHLDFQSSKKEESMRARTMCDTLWPGWDEIIEKKRLREKYTIDHISKSGVLPPRANVL